ncbi:MAG: hypothetical protein Q8P76_03165 [bacterium]|nr:hypothetical protein [bacterium]
MKKLVLILTAMIISGCASTQTIRVVGKVPVTTQLGRIVEIAHITTLNTKIEFYDTFSPVEIKYRTILTIEFKVSGTKILHLPFKINFKVGEILYVSLTENNDIASIRLRSEHIIMR